MSELVSCIMANYNTNEEHLKIAIDSILKQSYKNIEIIIVDDASTDSSLNLLKEYEQKYPNIKIIENEKNSGLAYSLNRAIDLAQGKYIARMDTDDISIKERLEKQVDYLEKNPQIDILGTLAKEFDKSHRLKLATFTNKEDCKSLLLFTNCLFHPSVMMKKEFLDKNNLRYDSNFLTSQDYDLWARASHYGNIEVLDEILLLYRIHGGQITEKKKERVRKYSLEISLRQLEKLGLKPEGKDLETHKIMCGLEPIDENNIRDLINWSEKILQANKEKQEYMISSLMRVSKFRLFTLISRSKISKISKIKYLKHIKAFNSFNMKQVYKRISYKINKKDKNIRKIEESVR